MDRHYEAFTQFYILEFEREYNIIGQFKMEFQDAITAFKLPHTARLKVKDKQLALTACPSISFNDMKPALKRILSDNGPQGGGGDSHVS